MPFQSEKQRKYLWANEPEIARDWTDTYGSGIAKALGGRIPFANGSFLSNIQPLQSFFETPQFTKDYSEAHNIAGDYPSTNGGSYEKQGLSSDVRHTLAASTGKDAFIDYISQFGFEPTGKIANLYGNLGITGATALHEIPDAWNIGKHAFKKGDYGAITSGDFLTQPWEDVKANLNVWDIPYGSTQEEKLSQIPTLKTINPFEATRLDDDDETGTIAFDPRNPQVKKTGILPFSLPPMLMKWMKAKTQGEGIGMIREKIQARNLAKKKAAMRQQVADAERQRLQARVTAQANRGAAERVARGEARDYGHTQTRSSSGWRSDPFAKGGIARLPLGLGSLVRPTPEALQRKGDFNEPVIEDFIRNDPFYWSGRYKLKNIRPYSEDPNRARAEKHIEKGSLGYNPYNDPAIYVKNINDPDPWVGSDVTHEGVHDVVAPTFASLTEKGIIQDVLTDYNSSLPPGDRNKIIPDDMNEIVTNYISNVIHGDVEPLNIENPTLIEALKKNIDPAIGQGFQKKWAARAHQNINAMDQKRLDQMLGRASVDEEDPYVDRIRNKINPVSQPQSFINRLRNRFYKPATRPAGGYNVAQLNRMNALGGYYSEPSRQLRRERSRVSNMLARKAAGKPYSQKNLNILTMGSRPGHYDMPGGNGGVQGTSSPAEPGGWHPGV